MHVSGRIVRVGRPGDQRLAQGSDSQGLVLCGRCWPARTQRRQTTETRGLILPAILAGATLGFAKAMGEFGATITFVSNIPGQTQTLPSAIYALLQVPAGEAQAMRLVLVSVAIAIGAVLVSEWLARRMAVRR